MSEWTWNDQLAAFSRGWGLFDDGERVCIQRLDAPENVQEEHHLAATPPSLRSDDAAELLVRRQAAAGDELCQRALAEIAAPYPVSRSKRSMILDLSLPLAEWPEVVCAGNDGRRWAVYDADQTKKAARRFAASTNTRSSVESQLAIEDFLRSLDYRPEAGRTVKRCGSHSFDVWRRERQFYPGRLDGPLLKRQRELVHELAFSSADERRSLTDEECVLLTGLSNMLDAIADDAHDLHGVDCLLNPDEPDEPETQERRPKPQPSPQPDSAGAITPDFAGSEEWLQLARDIRSLRPSRLTDEEFSWLLRHCTAQSDGSAIEVLRALAGHGRRVESAIGALWRPGTSPTGRTTGRVGSGDA